MEFFFYSEKKQFRPLGFGLLFLILEDFSSNKILIGGKMLIFAFRLCGKKSYVERFVKKLTFQQTGILIMDENKITVALEKLAHQEGRIGPGHADLVPFLIEVSETHQEGRKYREARDSKNTSSQSRRYLSNF